LLLQKFESFLNKISNLLLLLLQIIELVTDIISTFQTIYKHTYLK
jgi:hypothetical protein